MAGKDFNDRVLAARVRTMALEEIEKVLKEPEMTELKKQVLLKLAGTVLPRLNEHTGDSGEPLKIVFDSAFKDAVT